MPFFSRSDPDVTPLSRDVESFLRATSAAPVAVPGGLRARVLAAFERRRPARLDSWVRRPFAVAGAAAAVAAAVLVVGGGLRRAPAPRADWEVLNPGPATVSSARVVDDIDPRLSRLGLASLVSSDPLEGP